MGLGLGSPVPGLRLACPPAGPRMAATSRADTPCRCAGGPLAGARSRPRLGAADRPAPPTGAGPPGSGYKSGPGRPRRSAGKARGPLWTKLWTTAPTMPGAGCLLCPGRRAVPAGRTHKHARRIPRSVSSPVRVNLISRPPLTAVTRAAATRWLTTLSDQFAAVGGAAGCRATAFRRRGAFQSKRHWAPARPCGSQLGPLSETAEDTTGAI